MRYLMKTSLIASAALALPLAAGAMPPPATVAAMQAANAPKHGPIDSVAEKYQKARKPPEGQPQVPLTLSPGECKSFAKDFVSASGKDKSREAEGLFDAGAVYDQCGMTRDAEDMYKRALAKNPRFAPAMNNLGVIYQNAGQAQAALTQFEAAIRADPKSTLAV